MIEVASNDGYLLKNFVAAGILAWELSLLRARPSAESVGVPVLREFFARLLAKNLRMRVGAQT